MPDDNLVLKGRRVKLPEQKRREICLTYYLPIADTSEINLRFASRSIATEIIVGEGIPVQRAYLRGSGGIVHSKTPRPSWPGRLN